MPITIEITLGEQIAIIVKQDGVVFDKAEFQFEHAHSYQRYYGSQPARDGELALSGYDFSPFLARKL